MKKGCVFCGERSTNFPFIVCFKARARKVNICWHCEEKLGHGDTVRAALLAIEKAIVNKLAA